MQCATCQTDIADNALICFRCGTSTTDRRREPAKILPRSPTWVWIALVTLLLVAVVADWWLAAPLARFASAGVCGVTALTLWWRQRRRGS
jgi:Flp pilus assembly protein TadB